MEKSKDKANEMKTDAANAMEDACEDARSQMDSDDTEC